MAAASAACAAAAAELANDSFSSPPSWEGADGILINEGSWGCVREGTEGRTRR